MRLSNNRIAIGTAQFGMSYGIANRTGQVSESEISKIFEYAASRGVDMIDTAALYGSSESVIGRLAPENFRIVTKIAGTSIAEPFEASLKRLRRTSCYGVMVHHAEDLAGPLGKKVFRELEILKTKGQVQKIGLSVYNPEQAEALSSKYTLDLIQFPLNVLDQRFLPHLAALKMRGIELHARSIFLQGLLLMNSVPEHFSPVARQIWAFREQCARSGLSIRQGLIHFALSQPEVDQVVFGVDSLKQFQEIVDDVELFSGAEKFTFSDFRSDNPKMINPSLWPKEATV